MADKSGLSPPTDDGRASTAHITSDSSGIHEPPQSRPRVMDQSSQIVPAAPLLVVQSRDHELVAIPSPHQKVCAKVRCTHM